MAVRLKREWGEGGGEAGGGGEGGAVEEGGEEEKARRERVEVKEGERRTLDDPVVPRTRDDRREDRRA